MLDEDHSFQEIANTLGKDPTTISKEIRRNITIHHPKREQPTNKCLYSYTCQLTNICNKDKPCSHVRKCKQCNYCNKKCSKFTPNACYNRTHKAPYVCNGCQDRKICRLTKRYYIAENSQDKYKTLLTESRQGINLTFDEHKNLNTILSENVKRGQTLAHIYYTHKNDFNCSLSTLYRYIDQCVLDVRNIDLPRKVKYKPRKPVIKISKETKMASRTHRTLEDFNNFILTNNIDDYVEMDTVLGSRESQVSLLTIMFRRTRLMLLFTLDEHTADNVCEVFDYLELSLGSELFEKMFPCILTDNGCEFMSAYEIEHRADGSKRTNLFYCNPNSPYQKGAIEKNHEFIRYVLPKGTNFNHLTQQKVTLLANHINSLKRGSLNENSPISIAKMLYPQEFFTRLHLYEIPADDVMLKPSLLKL